MKLDIHAMPYEREGHKMLRIECDVDILYPIAPDRAKRKRVRALWDTGATNTCIPMKTAVAMGIPQGDELPMRMGASVGKSHFCKFLLGFPTGDIIRITEGVAVPNMQTDLIIGMDIISRGVTAIQPDGEGGVHFTFTL